MVHPAGGSTPLAAASPSPPSMGVTFNQTDLEGDDDATNQHHGEADGEVRYKLAFMSYLLNLESRYIRRLCRAHLRKQALQSALQTCLLGWDAHWYSARECLGCLDRAGGALRFNHADGSIEYCHRQPPEHVRQPVIDPKVIAGEVATPHPGF